MNINKIRITNLRRIIFEDYNNSIHYFAKAIGRHSSQFYNLFKGDRSFGQKLARDLELKLNLPPLSLDKSSTKETTTNKILLIPEYYLNTSTVIETRNHIFTIEKTIVEDYGWPLDKLYGLVMRDESMAPTITINSKVLVDTSQIKLDDSKIYALFHNNKIIIKRVFYLSNNTLYEAKSDNAEYETIKFKPDQIKVIGRILCILNKIL